ncbi:MAG: YwiC-like family protein [Candidatus Latescibacterota bacterium]|nr:MAG: YwiC-like family protein [Candidatus Latescibacterota bacterium]
MTGKVRIKSIALPVEHGGWGFLFEPILLAFIIVPSLAGLCVAVSAVAMFLLRHPLKIYLRGSGSLVDSPRRRVAFVVCGVYGVVALAGITGCIGLAGPRPLAPFVILSPFAGVYLFYDTKKQSRKLIAELAGPFGLAGVATGIALAGGWSWGPAVALWVVVMARTIPSIFYVRARLRLESGRPLDRGFVFVIHLLCALVVIVLIRWGMAPAMTLAAFGLLWVRALHGLSRFRRPSKAVRIGFQEIAYGLAYVVWVAIGYRVGL